MLKTVTFDRAENGPSKCLVKAQKAQRIILKSFRVFKAGKKSKSGLEKAPNKKQQSNFTKILPSLVKLLFDLSCTYFAKLENYKSENAKKSK